MAAPMTASRVVVTGLGIVSSLGCKINDVFTHILNKRIGLTKIDSPEFATLPCQVAGVVNKDVIDLEAEFTKTELREKSKPILFALAAARRALQDSSFQAKTQEQFERCGVSVGIGMPDLWEIYEAGKVLNEKGLKSLSPYFIPRNLVNMAAGHISIETGFKGPNLCVSTACTTGLHSIGEAYRLIERGDADLMLCGGAESPICPLSLAGFSRMKALCVDSNDSPNHASRPFDKSRSGFIMSEGAAVLVLESRRHAVNRGARIYAEIQGYGLSGDAHHISAPSADGNGAYRCMKAALNDAMLSHNDVSYVNAHATSTPLGDAAELMAIDKLFGGNRFPVNVSSIKGSIGHLLGAAGCIEAVITVLACYHGLLPPNTNLTNPEDSGRVKLITEANLQWQNENRIALTNSFGFGGTNASLCISNFTA